MRRIEESMLATWPSLTTAIDGNWVLRIAAGFTGRANALTWLDAADDGDLAARLDWAADIYRRHRLPPTFRVTPLTPPAAIAELDRRGAGKERASLVLAATADQVAAMLDGGAPAAPATGSGGMLADLPASPATEIAVRGSLDDEWLAFQRTHDARLSAYAETFREMMRRAAGPTAFVRVTRQGACRAALLAAIHRDHWTIHDVLSDPAWRRHGLARAAIAAACGWGLQHGARTFWIAVTESNDPAVRLYRSFGFEPAFRYHYRSIGGDAA